MNVALVLLDSLRADHVGCYGYGPTAEDWVCRTPAMDALARESIRFTKAFPESLPTIPVRRAVHTGLRTFPFRDWVPQKGDTVRAYGWQRIPEEQVTLAETLQAGGYTTAFVTDAYHQFKPSMNFHRGFDQWHWVRGQERDPDGSLAPVSDDQVERHMTAKTTSTHLRRLVKQYLANATMRRHEEDWQAPRVFLAAMRWLEENAGRGGKPFFLVVDSFDPHEPWDPPRYYTDLYDTGYDGVEMITPQYGPSDYLSPAELRHMRALYAGEVTMTDRWLGYFLDHLRASGALEDTLLIVTSDHGHQLGEHGLTGKISWGLHPELMDVPLFVRRPGAEGAGTTCDAFVQHHDLAPTMLAALGVQPAVAMRGQNALALLDGAPRRPYVTCGFNDYVWCRDERWVYIARNDGGDVKLYDVLADPAHTRDLAAANRPVADEMRRRVVADAGGEPLPKYDQQSIMARAWYDLP